jgi:hypothetical protein
MANKIYRASETAITFKESGGDAVITLKNLGAGVGRISAQYDRGAGSKPALYNWKSVFIFETAPVASEVVSIYLSESDGTYQDGLVGTVDAALTAARLVNLKLIGTSLNDTTLTGTSVIASGMCEIWEQNFSVGVWNGTADNLANADNASVIIFTPMPYEVQ